MRSMWLLTSMILIGSSCASAPPISPGFSVHQRLVLTQQPFGVDGSIEILRDQRLTEADIKALQEHDADTSPENSPRFRDNSLKQARLLLKTTDGRILQSVLLDKPYATLETAEIEKGKRTVLVTQDFGIGMGSYSGPITQILKLTHESMTWAMTRDLATGKESRISLMRSLKTAWDLASSKDGKSKDILEVSCRPSDSVDASGELVFLTTYTRYRHESQYWTRTEKSKKGFWEAEDEDQHLGYALPDLKNFP